MCWAPNRNVWKVFRVPSFVSMFFDKVALGSKSGALQTIWFVEGSICQRENMRKCSIGGTSMIDTGLVTWTSNSPWWRLCLPWLFGLRADVHLANYHVTPTARLNVDLWRCVKMITRWLDNTRVLKVVPAQIQPPASQRSGEIRNEVQWFIESLSIYSQIQIVSGVETVKRGKRYH